MKPRGVFTFYCTFVLSPHGLVLQKTNSLPNNPPQDPPPGEGGRLAASYVKNIQRFGVRMRTPSRSRYLLKDPRVLEWNGHFCHRDTASRKDALTTWIVENSKNVGLMGDSVQQTHGK